MIDIAVHIRADMVEPLRIAGNILGPAAAVIVLLGVGKAYAPHILGLAAIGVVALNAAHVSARGFGTPMLVFVGVSVLLLLRLAQVSLRQANAPR